MLVLVSGATRFPRGGHVGHLVVPRQWNDPASLDLQPGNWAMDDGCFLGFDPGAYLRMLYAYRGRPGALFVTVPDAVGDFAETRHLWSFWSPIVRALGHRPAFVAQNGMTPDRMPWDEMGALFIGGDDAFKDGPAVRSLCGYAKARGMWVHWGRVNGKRRYELALKAGADSIDGTGFSIAPNINIPKGAHEWRREIQQQPELELGRGA